MILFAWYVVKVLIVSGILCGYYYLALKDKIFHRWNRFYLLFTVALSLLLPFVSIDIFQAATESGTVIKVLQAVTVQDEIVIELGKSSLWSTNTIIATAYLFISFIFIGILLRSFLKIYSIRKNYPNTMVEGINFINTDAKGTPFSFFNSIFWNRSIDLHSTSGQQIFNHEIAHIKEKHTYDKIFMNTILLFFWINPFFWLIRKELNMIHEFIADKIALEDSDINAFAEMILASVYPGHQFPITNNFFYSPIKRRLLMLTKNKNSKVNYVSRLLVLPLAAIVFLAFALKMKTRENANIYTGNPITVMVDAGHGGTDPGAKNENITEKDLALAIAKKVKELNNNKNIKIILTREEDKFISVKDRVITAGEKKADLFISIHINAQALPEDKEPNRLLSGFQIVIPKEGNQYLTKSKVLASALVQSFQNNYPLPVDDILIQREIGIWVLKANQSPAVLIQTGFITNEKDLAFMKDPANQKLIAENILNGIENFAQNGLTATAENYDTIPEMYYQNKKVTRLQVREKDHKIKVTYQDGSTEMITKAEADKRGFKLPPPPPLPPNAPAPPPANAPAPPSPPSITSLHPDALYYLNDKESNSSEISKIPASEIKSISVLKGDKAFSKYGEKARNGVIMIYTKEYTNAPTPPSPPSNSFPKTDALYLLNDKETNSSEISKIPPNEITSISVLKDNAAISKYGEKGKNGVIQIYTNRGNEIKNDTIPDKTFTKVEQEAQFPGGPEAWRTFITRQITAVIDSFTEKDFGTCVVRFIVNKDGTVTHVEATTMQGTLLAEAAINAIRKGPKWNPAMQNGRKVNAYRLQPVTLTNPDKKDTIPSGSNPGG